MSSADGPRTMGWRLLFAGAVAAVFVTACTSEDPEPVATTSTTAPAAGRTAEDTTSNATSSAADPTDNAVDNPADNTVEDGELFPDVIEATAEQGSDGSWTILATRFEPPTSSM